MTSSWMELAPNAEALSPGKKWHVFLSYRSVNRPWVLNLYDVLRQHGHEVFLDQVVLAGGQQLIGKLKSNLKLSQAGVLIWSRAAADSKWVEKEYETMEAMATEDDDFHFVPVRLDDAELPGFADLRIFFDFTRYPDGPNGGELLRVLHAVLGKPLSEKAAKFAAEQDSATEEATAQIDAAIENGAGDRIVELFRQGGLPWETTSVLGCRALEGLTKIKRYDDALEVAKKLEERFPNAIRTKQLHALALARRAAGSEDETERARDLGDAQALLGALRAKGHRDPETLGIYARTWMDRYATSGDLLELRHSRDLYAEAFEGARDDYYTGINAAAKSVLLGTEEDIKKAMELAERVEQIVGTEAKRGDYWATATVAEVQLLRKSYALAGKRYADAVAQAPSERGSHETTWKQACRLMRKLSPSADERAQIRAAFQHLPDCEEVLAGELSKARGR